MAQFQIIDPELRFRVRLDRFKDLLDCYGTKSVRSASLWNISSAKPTGGWLGRSKTNPCGASWGLLAGATTL